MGEERSANITTEDKHTKKQVGFAIVGVGELAEGQLLPAFKECQHATVVALVSDDEEKTKALAKEYGINEENIYNYENFDNIASNKEVEVVYIVLPNSLHKEFTIRAAQAGKHVLCEKPIAATTEDAQQMITACKNANRFLMVAYRVQYEPHHQLMKDWVRNNIFGKVKIIECFNGQYIDDASQWRFKKALAGGGSLMDLGIYCVNTTRYLTGLEPSWVSANLYSTPNDDRFKEVEETVLFQMGFPDGTLATCATSYGIFDTQRYRCFTGKDAWFGMDPAFPYKDLKIEISTASSGEKFPLPVIEHENQFTLLIDHMALAVFNNEPPDTPGEEGLQDLVIMNAIYRSAAEQRVIHLDTSMQKDLYRRRDKIEGKEPV